MRILKNSLIPILCLLMILVLNKESVKVNHIPDLPIIEEKIILTYQDALESSRNNNKYILLLVDSKWCGYCAKFKKEVLSEE